MPWCFLIVVKTLEQHDVTREAATSSCANTPRRRHSAVLDTRHSGSSRQSHVAERRVMAAEEDNPEPHPYIHGQYLPTYYRQIIF